MDDGEDEPGHDEQRRHSEIEQPPGELRHELQKVPDLHDDR